MRTRRSRHDQLPPHSHPVPRSSRTDALLAGEAAAGALRGIEVASIVLLGLLMCPPLAILAVSSSFPCSSSRSSLGLLPIVLSTPYLLVHHLRGHHGGHLSLLAHRLRHAGRALIDLLPHRIVADARKADPASDRHPIRHLRPRGTGETQQTTPVELFFDLVYVFAVTQLSHQILGALSVAGAARAAFLLLVVWWAWIYTTWMTNWFDPASSAPVRGVLTAVMLGSLLMAAALPEAFGERRAVRGELRRAPGRPQRGGGVAAQAPPPAARHVRAARRLARRVRRALAGRRGARRRPAARLWIPALALELAAPAAGSGCRVAAAPPRPTTTSRVRTSPSAARSSSSSRSASRSSSRGDRSAAGLARRSCWPRRRVPRDRGALVAVLRCDGRARARPIGTCDDPGRVARDAYTYAHLPIVAGFIATAVGSVLLVAAPHEVPNGVGVAMILGGPALYLLGESLFGRRITGATNTRRMAVAALLVLLVPLGGAVSVLLLSLSSPALPPALAVWELRAPTQSPARPDRTCPRAPREAPCGC